MRTTIALDNFLIRKVKSISHKEGKTFTKMVSELLSLGLKAKETKAVPSAGVKWHTQPMGEKFDISDKDLLYKALDSKE
jgi:hypothetical protein